MRRHVGLARLLEKDVPLGTRGKGFGLALDLPGPCRESMLKFELSLETSLFEHAALFPSEEAGARTGRSRSPINAKGRAVMNP